MVVRLGGLGSESGASVIRIPPYQYIHVLNTNTNVTSVEVGPQTFTRQEHMRVVGSPKEMINIPPRSFTEIKKPGHAQR